MALIDCIEVARLSPMSRYRGRRVRQSFEKGRNGNLFGRVEACVKDECWVVVAMQTAAQKRGCQHLDKNGYVAQAVDITIHYAVGRATRGRMAS